MAQLVVRIPLQTNDDDGPAALELEARATIGEIADIVSPGISAQVEYGDAPSIIPIVG